MPIGAIGAGVSIGTSLINNASGIISAGQDATEKRKWGKQARKQQDSDWNRQKQQEDYQSALNKHADSESIKKNEMASSMSGTSLLGRWTNESRDYNKYKNQVDSDLRKSGDIRTETYKDGTGKNAKTKSRDVYSADVDNKRADLYSKYTGYNMTLDQNNKLIGGQSWDDVNQNDEAILAGEAESMRRRKNFQSNAYGVRR